MWTKNKKKVHTTETIAFETIRKASLVHVAGATMLEARAGSLTEVVHNITVELE